jgi:hypothetical protein
MILLILFVVMLVGGLLGYAAAYPAAWLLNRRTMALHVEARLEAEAHADAMTRSLACLHPKRRAVHAGIEAVSRHTAGIPPRTAIAYR